MRNTWKIKNLNERPAGRVVLALSLAASLAAFGCTTNRTPGNGEPVGVVRPGVGPAPPTTGVTGTSSGSNPPMFSSSTYVEALPTVNARSRRLPLSPDEAAAIMAGNQFGRGARVLGPVNPGNANGTMAIASGQFQNPAMNVNPILTVNSSINSAAHLPAVTEGSGGGGGTAAIVSGATVTGTTGVTSNATVGTTTTGSAITTGTTVTGASGTTVSTTAAAPGTGAAVFLPSTSSATPTTAAPPFTAGNFATGTGTLTPTVSSGATTTPTVSTSTVAGTLTGTTTTNGTTATSTSSTRRATTTTRATSTTVGSASANIASPVRVTTDANGKKVITNSKEQ